MKKLILSILAILLCLSAFTLIACNGDDSTTVNKTVPTFEIIDPVAYKSSVEFEIAESDPDNIGDIISIELYKGDSKIRTAENKDVRRFEGLDSNTTYTIKVKYEYDLQNGEGKKVEEISATVKTIAGYTSSNDIKRDWSGKTLNIACSTWSAEPSAPWSVLELCVDYGKESGFGTKIDAAVLERQEFIKETYGVDLNWINATRYTMHDALEEAIASGNVYYDLAFPRAMRVQSIVANGSVYDLANRDYIDFSNYYYNKDSVETYTAKGHTFFVDGSFSITSIQTADVLFFNKNVLKDVCEEFELYKMVREGEWTFDKMLELAITAYKDDGCYGDTSTYGIICTSHSVVHTFFGVKRVKVDEATGEWTVSLNDLDMQNIISAVNSAYKSNYWRSYMYGLGSSVNVFRDNLMLFYQDELRNSDIWEYENIGVVPFPMFNESQGRYCVPCNMSIINLMCIPKNTQDRSMSEYFLDVLSWTGSEYTYKAYIEQKSEFFKSEYDMEMITEYIIPNISYDAGAAVNWGTILYHPVSDMYVGYDEYKKSYDAYRPSALEILTKWNEAWGGYTEN